MMNLQTECADYGAEVTGAEIVSALVRGEAIVLRETIITTLPIRATRPKNCASVASLPDGPVQAGILTDGTRDTIIAMADRPQSWAEANNTEVTARAVAMAQGAN